MSQSRRTVIVFGCFAIIGVTLDYTAMHPFGNVPGQFFGIATLSKLWFSWIMIAVATTGLFIAVEPTDPKKPSEPESGSGR